jgi:hypothetical protein
MRRSSPFLLAALLGLVWPSVAVTAEPLKQSLADLHALIKPQAAEEAWSKIPWMTSLWEARKKAAAAGKPILLWEMDGHPLGCT